MKPDPKGPCLAQLFFEGAPMVMCDLDVGHDGFHRHEFHTFESGVIIIKFERDHYESQEATGPGASTRQDHEPAADAQGSSVHPE